MEDFFVSVVGFIAISSACSWIIFGLSGRNESSDKLTFAFAGLAALVFGIFALRRDVHPSAIDLLSAAGLISILVGIGIVENKAMSKEHPMGFGIWVLVLTLLLIPISSWIIRSKQSKPITKYVAWVPALFVIFCVSIAFWQTRVTLLESGHSE
jgi:hypothetical protein